MKKILLASVAISALIAAQAASAQRLSPPPMAPTISWTGCFVGGQVGWGWQRNKISQSSQHFSSSSFTTAGFNSSSSGNVDSHGAVFGGQVGCDYQVGNGFVIGAQGTFLASHINGIGQDPHNGAIDFNQSGGLNGILEGGSIGVTTNWIGSATARLGFAGWSPQTLLYVRGGAAWTQMQYDLRSSTININYGGYTALNGALFDVSHSGWTIGGGIEWMFATNWSAFAEFNYYKFNSLSITVDQGGGAISTFTSQPNISTATVGLNYRLNFLGMH
jgi:outer membrane immunogenic protein